MKPNGLLPNLRFITLPSEGQGEDWMERSSEIDAFLGQTQWELSEETVYLIFEGEGAVVARPVIGPKLTVEKPFTLLDWVSTPVEIKAIQASSWELLLEQISSEKATRRTLLSLKRRLTPTLSLRAELIFLS